LKLIYKGKDFFYSGARKDAEEILINLLISLQEMKKSILIFIAAMMTDYCFSQNFVNPSVEAWSSSSVCETNLPPDGWSNYSNVGLGPDEGNLTLCPSTIPPQAADGNIYARCLAGNPNTGEGLYQNVSGFTIGGTYSVIYSFSGSNRWGGSGDCVWHLFIDDVDVNQSVIFSSADTVWQTNSFIFIASALTHKIGFRAYTPTYNGGGSAGIDRFIIIRTEVTDVVEDNSSHTISIYPNPAHDAFSVSIDGSTLGGSLVNGHLSICDIMGREVFIATLNSGLQTLNANLSAGVYFVRITARRKVTTQKLVIE
jgi:hypothetical protein